MHYKVKRILPVFFVLIILCLVTVKVAVARRWVGNDTLWWTIEDEMVCRDGVLILSYDDSSYLPPDDPDYEELLPYPNRLYTRLYDADPTVTKPPDDDGFGDYPESYGPRITATQVFTLTYHTDAAGEYVPFPINDPDLQTEYFLYSIGKLTWPRALPVGAKVLVQSLSNGLILDGVVQDCYLNLLNVPPGGVVIDNQRLYADTGILDQTDAVFRLDAAPAHGALWLDGVPLEAGDTFTQNDVDNGLLRYDHDASGATEDSFDFTLLPNTRRLSTGSGGADSNGGSFSASVSADGQYVAFASDATNLVEEDLNGFSDIFYQDLHTRQTGLISLADNGAQGNGGSYDPAVSSTGYTVAYESTASNLVNGGSSDSCQYRSDLNGFKDIFSVNVSTQNDETFELFNIQRISVEDIGFNNCTVANGNSSQAAISEDFGSVVFTSEATNLEVNDLNGSSDVFINDGFSYFQINPLSKNQGNGLGDGHSSSPSIRSDPYFGDDVIAFQSFATNLLGDTNSKSDIFVSDVVSDVVRVSVSSSGVQANGHSFEPSISAGGRFVVFASGATNLAAGSDTNGKSDVFLRDRDTDEDGVLDEVGAASTTLISALPNGSAGNGASALAYITANGHYIVFTSWASDIVSGDSNGVGDVFVYDRQLDKMTRVSVGENGGQGDDGSFSPVISDDGDYVVFESDASNLTEDDHNEYRDVFVHYRGFSTTFALGILPSERIYLPVLMDMN
jgi:hypothetical protein